LWPKHPQSAIYFYSHKKHKGHKTEKVFHIHPFVNFVAFVAKKHQLKHRIFSHKRHKRHKLEKGFPLTFLRQFFAFCGRPSFFPPSGPTLRLPQEPPAKGRFLGRFYKSQPAGSIGIHHPLSVSLNGVPVRWKTLARRVRADQQIDLGGFVTSPALTLRVQERLSRPAAQVRRAHRGGRRHLPHRQGGKPRHFAAAHPLAELHR
jgi:hypothetical protein